MSTKKAPPKNVDEYIATFPADVQSILVKIRATIRKAAPRAEETVRYGMPAYQLHGKLVEFAAFKNHVGFYPRKSAIEYFREQLSGYKSEKGTVRFPLDQPIPYKLVEQIVKFRVEESIEQAAISKVQ